MDDGLGSDRGPEKFSSILGDGDDRSEHREESVVGEGSSHPISFGKSTFNFAQRRGKKHLASGHSSEASDRAIAAWTNQADGFNGEVNPPSCPSRFDDESSCDNSGE
jgi:hypothetical protein